MEKNIKIADLVKKLSNLSDTAKIEYIKKNIKSESYVPWAEKVALATNIVNATTYDLEKKEDGTFSPTNNIKVDSNNRFVLFVVRVIQRWTNIEILENSENSENIMQDFDDLNRLGVIDIIMNPENGIIPARELNEFNVVVENCYNDIWVNYSDPHNYIANQVERFGTLLGITLKPVLDKIATSIENLDEKDIEKFSNRLEKALKRSK